MMINVLLSSRRTRFISLLIHTHKTKGKTPPALLRAPIRRTLQIGPRPPGAPKGGVISATISTRSSIIMLRVGHLSTQAPPIPRDPCLCSRSWVQTLVRAASSCYARGMPSHDEDIGRYGFRMRVTEKNRFGLVQVSVRRSHRLIASLLVDLEQLPAERPRQLDYHLLTHKIHQSQLLGKQLLRSWSGRVRQGQPRQTLSYQPIVRPGTLSVYACSMDPASV